MYQGLNAEKSRELKTFDVREDQVPCQSGSDDHRTPTQRGCADSGWLFQSIRVAGPEATRPSPRCRTGIPTPRVSPRRRPRRKIPGRAPRRARVRRAAPHPASPRRMAVRDEARATTASWPRRSHPTFCSARDRSSAIFFGGISGRDDRRHQSLGRARFETERIGPGPGRGEASSPAAGHARRSEREGQSGGRDGCRRYRDQRRQHGTGDDQPTEELHANSPAGRG